MKRLLFFLGIVLVFCLPASQKGNAVSDFPQSHSLSVTIPDSSEGSEGVIIDCDLPFRIKFRILSMASLSSGIPVMTLIQAEAACSCLIHCLGGNHFEVFFGGDVIDVVLDDF